MASTSNLIQIIWLLLIVLFSEILKFPYIVLSKKITKTVQSEHKKISLEPELNQRPKDVCNILLYSPPLYQLSYRGFEVVDEF